MFSLRRRNHSLYIFSPGRLDVDGLSTMFLSFWINRYSTKKLTSIYILHLKRIEEIKSSSNKKGVTMNKHKTNKNMKLKVYESFIFSIFANQ